MFRQTQGERESERSERPLPFKLGREMTTFDVVVAAKSSVLLVRHNTILVLVSGGKSKSISFSNSIFNANACVPVPVPTPTVPLLIRPVVKVIVMPAVHLGRTPLSLHTFSRPWGSWQACMYTRVEVAACDIYVLPRAYYLAAETNQITFGMVI